MGSFFITNCISFNHKINCFSSIRGFIDFHILAFSNFRKPKGKDDGQTQSKEGGKRRISCQSFELCYNLGDKSQLQKFNEDQKSLFKLLGSHQRQYASKYNRDYYCLGLIRNQFH